MADQTIHVATKVDTKEVKDAKHDFGELKDKVKELASEVPGLSAAMDGLGSVTSSLGGLMEGGALAIGGLAIAAAAAVVAVAALGVAMAFEWAEKIDKLADLGAKMGLTADQTYYLKGAMENAGLSVESLMGGQERLAKAMMKSGDDTKGAGAAFERLGVATEDAHGQLRATADVLAELSAKYKDEKENLDLSKLSTQEMADLQLTLGKNYREVLVAETERTKALEIYNEMVGAGIGISKEAQELASKQEEGQLRLGAIFNQVGGIMVELVLPAFNELVSWFVQSYKEGGVVAQTFNVLALTVKIVVAVVKDFATSLGILVDYFKLVGSVGVNTFSAISKAMTGDFSGALNQYKAGVTQMGNGLLDLGKRWIDNRKATAEAMMEAVTGFDMVGKAQEKFKKGGDAGGNKSLLPGGGVAGGKAPVAGGDAKEKVDPILALIAGLEKQLRVSDELNISEQIAIELQGKKYAGSDKALKQQAQEIANNVAIANANKSVRGLTEELEKQTRTAEGLNAVESLEQELLKKKNVTADEATKAAARSAAADKDRTTASKSVTDFLKSQTKATDDYVQALRDEIQQKGMNARDIKEEMQFRKMDADTQKEINDLKEKHIWSLTEENRLLEANAIAKGKVRDATDAAKAADDNWLGNGVQAYVDGLGTMEKAASSLVNKGLKGVEDGLTSLFTGGDFSWKSFVKSILDGLVQMIVQFTIMKPIMESFKASMSGLGGGGGSALGGIGSFIGSLFSAQGNVFSDHHAQGAVSSPTQGFFGPNGVASTIGEAGDEAVMPLKKNAAGDLGVIVTGGGSSGGQFHQVNHITIENSGNGSDEDNERLAATLNATLEKKYTEMYQKANRAGGMANRTSLAL